MMRNSHIGADAEPVVTDSPIDPIIAIISNSKLFEVEHYSKQVPELKWQSREDYVQHYISFGEADGLTPSPFFDPIFYARTYPDLSEVESKFGHFLKYGDAEMRHGTLASFLIKENLDLIAIEGNLIPEPRRARGSPDYLRALVRATKSGEKDKAYFSGEIYLRMYPDLRNTSIPPLVHYLIYGRNEKRKSNLDVLDSMSFNDRVLIPGRPYIMVGVHECSRTGAPRVGLDLAFELSHRFNVIFVALDDGPLLSVANYYFPVTILASKNSLEALLIYDLLRDHCPFDQAIFSSVVSEPFLRGLAETNVQLICLVHEFRDEYFAVERSIFTFCDLLVFSSRQLLASWAGLILEIGRPTVRSLVLPQPPSGSGARRLDKAAARAELERQTGLNLDGATLVLAAGLVQMRKGTDIFLQVATDLRRKRRRYVCVWIGKQVNSQHDAFGVWLHAHIARSSDSVGRPAVHFLPPGPLYDVLMDAADVFVVPSRMDPLPNVAIDAAVRMTPVIAFAGATGLLDIAELGRMSLLEVEYGSVPQMVEAIEQMSSPRQSWLRNIGGRKEVRAAAAEASTYEHYAHTILECAERLRSFDRDDPDIMIDPDYTGPVMRTRFDPFVDDAEKESSIRLTQKALRLGIATINPAPGVHSGRNDAGALPVYRSVWCQGRKIENWPANAVAHIHAFYPEVLEYIFQHFSRTARDARIVLTTPTNEKAAKILDETKKWGFKNIELIVCANSGRDIGPFIDHMSSRCASNDIVCHVHTKKSPEAGDWFGEKWRDNMFDSILSQPALDLFADPDVGLVLPDNPRNNGWGDNWDEASRIASAWQTKIPLHPGPFPIGNMFWIRGDVLAAMREATQDVSWPKEPISLDGTVLHAIERLWPMACHQVGRKLAAVHARVRREQVAVEAVSSKPVVETDIASSSRRRDRFFNLIEKNISSGDLARSHKQHLAHLAHLEHLKHIAHQHVAHVAHLEHLKHVANQDIAYVTHLEHLEHAANQHIHHLAHLAHLEHLNHLKHVSHLARLEQEKGVA